jgi:hypothetical protein
VDHPEAVAIDPAVGLIYWVNFSGSVVSFARLDGSGGGGNIATTGATAANPMFLALLEAPDAEEAPTLTGRRRPGSRLSCTSGSWLADLAPSFLAQAPQTLSYRWTRNGTQVGTGASLIARRAGSYRCTVAAANAAGETVQASATHAILADCVVPRVVGKSLRKARLAIRRRHCRTGKIARAFSAKVARGRVVAQRPRPARKLPNGAKVRLVVSRGKRR